MLSKICDAIIKQVLLSETYADNNDGKRALIIKDYIELYYLKILLFLYLILIYVEE